MQRKYNFEEILKEYNKKYKHKHKLPSEAFNVIIVHIIETNVFYVTYSNKDELFKRKTDLGEFIYYYISSDIATQDIKNIIISKEEKSLNLEIEIWPPSKIRYAYLDTNYFVKKGDLGSSCMRSKEMQKALNFYVKNKTRIVVVVDNKNKIHARALLWDNVKSTKLKKPFTYLDRVYTRSNTLLPLFYTLSQKNKWRQYKGTSVGNGEKGLYKDNLDITGICHLPYTDTFRNLYYKDNIISSSYILNKIKYKNDVLNLTTTGNGGYFPTLDPDRVREALTGNYISKKDAIFIKRYNGYILRRNVVSINSDYYSIHDNKIVKTALDGYILKENSTNEVITNNMIDKTTAVHSVKYNGYIHKSNAIKIGDEIYHKDDAEIVCFRVEKTTEDKWYHISQCFINYNREDVNKELAKQPIFFYKALSETLKIQYWIPYATVTREGNLIPKKHAIIAYNLAYNAMLDDIEYQEVYCTDKTSLIQLITGELIVNSAENKKYLKKFNNKYYIRQTFKLPDKNQLLLF